MGGESDVDENSSQDDASSQEETPQPTLLVDAAPKSKWANFVTRASLSLVMIFSFLFIIVYLQHNGCILLVFAIQTAMYSELIQINKKPERERQLSVLSAILPWIWFASFTSLIYFYILWPQVYIYLGTYFPEHQPKDFSQIVEYAKLSAFSVYISSVVLFVLSLKRRHYKYQFQKFGLCHVVLLLVVGQSSAIVSNLFYGLYWFLFPCSLVVCNDIFAYIFGFFFGRTPLIQLSPKKTWEGFIGGFFSTLVFGHFFARVLVHFPLMTCPKEGFALLFWPKCDLPEYFEQQELQQHALYLSLFASLVAPFGGFFASGFKRAFKIKDFGNSIPGHGGMTDRMDCQMIMGAFTFVYLRAFIHLSASSGAQMAVQKVIESAERLSQEQQLVVFNHLKSLLDA
eukprot:maker-scaffold_56-snap-gene-1.77-mRNA-1 protein AED:0.02 eAED:0.02 QI:423/1/1/1/1/1/2/87/398